MSMMSDTPSDKHTKPSLGKKPALGPTYSVFRYPRLDSHYSEPEWCGRFEDLSFGGFEDEAQALRWVLRRMDEAYRDALEDIARRVADSFIAALAVSEITTDRCALCERGWDTEGEYSGRYSVYFHHPKRDDSRPRAVHGVCYRNFVTEISAIGIDWQAMRQEWRDTLGQGVFKPGDMTLWE